MRCITCGKNKNLRQIKISKVLYLLVLAYFPICCSKFSFLRFFEKSESISSIWQQVYRRAVFTINEKYYLTVVLNDLARHWRGLFDKGDPFPSTPEVINDFLIQKKNFFNQKSLKFKFSERGSQDAYNIMWICLDPY